MVTLINGEYYGKSTDEKPKAARNGQTFYEMDTCDIYMFDGETGEWLIQRKK